MNNLLQNTSGIDCEIKSMQKGIYDALIVDFGNVEGFGRVYRVPTDNQPIPCVFKQGTGKDYQEVYLDDRNSIQFCFIDSETHKTKDGVLYSTPVKVVFWFNLNVIGKGYRADAEAHRIVSTIFKDDLFNEFTYDSIEKGIESIFRGFDTSKIKNTDMHTYHVFSFNIDLNYYLTRKCN